MNISPMKNTLALLLLFTCVATAATSVAAKGKAGKQPINTDSEPYLKGEGFVSLFDGKTLDGWVTRQGTMKFEAIDGEIVGTCSKGPSTFLCTEKDYTDFVFTCEFKWAVDGNSGVQVRSRTRKGKDVEIVFGPQVEMEDLAKKGRGWSGGIYGQACGGWFYPLKSPEHRPLKDIIDRSGWNRMTVKVQGNVFKTWINGQPAANWIDEENEYPNGFIGLQVHGGKQGTIHWRNLSIKEL
ncbi:hypothetical protein LF1_15960 [Rubripirellula obstinata]|uniref:3-keto-alpha-glucoside-1,2-lyase/3-keto-2-hydroxy-glucal hydratase domain-containing protein n=1 Tax=Rubripirellula obstinata TaxID=406547 RepID=A0A5B1CHN0_9BACT|nr:DUF1080 domain-containing protein [Rubripirellula obstinata]KAA1259070.1 hypothetical protein LF1_15960 [Rubripirellula obstinata]